MTNHEINPTELSTQLRQIHKNIQEAITVLFNQMVEVDKIANKLQKGGGSND